MYKLFALLICFVPSIAIAQQTYLGNAMEVSVANYVGTNTTVTINAAGEYHGVVGRLHIVGGGSKTCSTSGCVFYWTTAGAATFANAATRLIIGLQDPGTGFGDGTYDVYRELVGGTDTILSTQENAAVVNNGSRTYNNNEAVAFKIEMTVLGGADSVPTDSVSGSAIGNNAMLKFPYAIRNTGTPLKFNEAAPMMMKFDDGTWGWIDGINMMYSPQQASSATVINTGTNPDELCAVVQFEVPLTLPYFGLYLAAVAATDTHEYTLYTAPLTSPSLVETITMNPNRIAAGIARGYFTTPREFDADTDYAFCVRPTSANSINFTYYSLSTVGVAPGHKKALPFVKSIIQAGRQNQTGAFAETNAVDIPVFAFGITSLLLEPSVNAFPALLLAP